MQNTFQYNKHGFTLVELAIVITIIGILIGGVLKGQQLIDQARLAATISQVNNYRTSLQIFKTTYNALPGDMPNPDDRIVGCTDCAAASGTGNGAVGGGRIWGHQSDKTTELTRFWLHLYKADMINGITDAALTEDGVISFGTTHPASKIAGGFQAQTSSESCGGWVGQMWGGCHPAAKVIIYMSKRLGTYYDRMDDLLSPAQVAQMDRKMDDGRPLSGDVRGVASDIGNGCTDENDNYPEGQTSRKVCAVGFIIDR